MDFNVALSISRPSSFELCRLVTSMARKVTLGRTFIFYGWNYTSSSLDQSYAQKNASSVYYISHMVWAFKKWRPLIYGIIFLVLNQDAVSEAPKNALFMTGT
jgi:hypothetical protein